MNILSSLCAFLIFSFIGAEGMKEPVFHRFEYEFKVLEKLVDYGKSIHTLNTHLQELKQKIEELKSQTLSTKQMEQKVMQFKANSDISTTYVRWGKSSCPDGATVVYDGFAAGSHYTHTGAAANHICLHRNPKWDDNTENQISYSLVYGAEYQTASSVWKNLYDHDVPCAVCQTPKSSVHMVPGRNDCSQNYTLEYNGYLMSGHHSHAAATEFVCVDREAEAAPFSSAENKDGRLFYFVHAACGALKCPPYEQGKEVTCAVCSYSRRI